MIEFNLQEILNQKGKSIYWLMNETGKSFQSLTNLTKKDLSGIHFDTLEQLCNIFDCEVGELIVLKKENKKEKKRNEQSHKKTK